MAVPSLLAVAAALAGGLRPEGPARRCPRRPRPPRRPPRRRPRDERCPARPHLACRGAELCLEGCSLDALARELRHAAVRLFARAMLDALAAYQRALAGRDAPDLLRDEGQLQPGRAADLRRRPAAASTSSRAASSSACWPPAATPAQGRVLRRRQDARRDAPRAAGRRALLQRRERGRARRAVAGGAWPPGRTRAVSLRVNPDVDAGTHPYISTGLKGNKFGIAHDQALAAYRRAAALPGPAGGRASTATSARRSPQIEPYLDALDRLLDLVEAVEADGIAHPPPRRRRRPGHHLHRRDAARAPTSWCARCSQRIDARGHGHRELLFEPGRSLVGNAGVLLTEVLYLKPGERRTSASSTRR